MCKTLVCLQLQLFKSGALVSKQVAQQSMRLTLWKAQKDFANLKQLPTPWHFTGWTVLPSLLQCSFHKSLGGTSKNKQLKANKFMNEAFISIMVSVVGLLSGVIGATIAARYQIKLEQEKWRAMRQDSLEKETRLAVAELCQKMVEVVQEIGWLSWSANYQPNRINLEHAKEYDLKIKQLLPQVMSSLVVVSSLDSSVHTTMDMLVKKVYALDSNMSKALIVFEKSRKNGIKALKTCHPDVKEFWETLNIAVADQFNVKTSKSAKSVM